MCLHMCFPLKTLALLPNEQCNNKTKRVHRPTHLRVLQLER